MTPDKLKAWRRRLGFSLTTGGEALGLSRREFARLLEGTRVIPKAVALACGRIEEIRIIEAWARKTPARERRIALHRVIDVPGEYDAVEPTVWEAWELIGDDGSRHLVFRDDCHTAHALRRGGQPLLT